MCATRIALVGWSHGGSTVLLAADAARQTADAPRPVTVIAFYPGCRPVADRAAYAPALPLTILIGLLKRPKYELNWILGWGIVSVPALWCLVLIPLMELLSFLWRAWYYDWAWSWTPGAHLLGMFCGVAAVLLLPKTVTMRRRSWVDGV